MASISTPLEAAPVTRPIRVRTGLAGFRTFMLYAVLCGMSLFFLFPLMWMVGTSFKTLQEIGQPQLNLLPANFQFENYAKVLGEDSFYRAYTNSIFIVTVVLFGTVLSISLVAFAFSRLT